jgi:hypothetical protein
MTILAGREIIFEFRVSGGFEQVCAFDCATGVEVFVTTPPAMMQGDKQNLALRKLAKALVDKGVINPQEKSDTPREVPLSPKRGFLA